MNKKVYEQPEMVEMELVLHNILTGSVLSGDSGTLDPNPDEE